MASSWLPTVASAGTNVISTLLSLDASREAEDRAYKRSLEMQKMQNDWNKKMWDMSNRYNSPSNQIQLLKDAGINPNIYDANGGLSSASELTASDASVPMNNEIGKLMQNLDPASKVIQALSADAQISKLRNEIKYQDMVNEDYRLLLESRKENTPVVKEDGTPFLDEEGNPVTANWYRIQRAKSDIELEEKGADATQKWENVLKSRNEREVYEAVKPFLKKMPEKQLKSLEEDINAKVANNTLLEADVELMKKYGISPSDKDGFQAFSSKKA